MSLALILTGLLFFVASVRGTQGELFHQIGQDLSGPDNFLQWMLALGMVGALGFVPALQGLSVAFLVLILTAIFLRRGTGFFAQLASATGLPQTQGA